MLTNNCIEKNIIINIEKNFDHSIINFGDEIDASKITKNIYLGSYSQGAKSYKGLKTLGITHNIMIGNLNQMPIPFPNEIIYKCINLDDSENVNIKKYFNECLDFIYDAIKKNIENKILINCWAGISRSATIVIAFLIHSMCLNYLEAFETVRKARYWINPNKGFKNQLIEWSFKNNLKISKKMIKSYEKSRKILRKIYKNNFNFNDEIEIKNIFIFIFGNYHIHTIDIKNELFFYHLK